ncbi:MAG TPA: MEDS domain-containing protein, partial [Sphingobacteriaceae bacterium]
KEKGRKVRAFGEMVAVLWAEGNSGATVQLEHLWNEFCSNMELTLFCAYPKSGFTDAPESSLQQICRAHARIISGEQVSENMLSYKP